MSHENHYQLCNRFAWYWKLANLGMPVVLVYLGFLKAQEMGDHFETHQDWEDAVRKYAKGVILDDIWGHKLLVEGILIYPLVKSLEYPLELKKDCVVRIQTIAPAELHVFELIPCNLLIHKCIQRIGPTSLPPNFC